MTPKDILKKYFGYAEFRAGQEEIVTSIATGHDTLALLPTGGGKSICFQVPGLLLGGTTIVITPLISLMKDQVDHLVAKKIKAAYISSTQTPLEKKLILDSLKKGELQFLYISPERAVSTFFAKSIENVVINLIVIDEAHCISQWGNSFRKEYKQLQKLISLFSTRPIVAAFTATATKEVKADIVNSLGLLRHQEYAIGSHRTNLSISVLPCPDKTTQVLQLLKILQKHQGQSGIVYASTRIMTEYLAESLNYFGHLPYHVEFYHGGLTAQQRDTIQTNFITDTSPVIVATNAFGMGIDKPNIRFVVHYHIPGSLEAYSQEIGRAGRDGQSSQTYLLFNTEDLTIHQALIAHNKDQIVKQVEQQRLINMIKYASSKSCRTLTLAQYFDRNVPIFSCHQCDVCEAIYDIPIIDINLEDTVKKLLNLRTLIANELQLPRVQVLTTYQCFYAAIIKPTDLYTWLKIPGLGLGWSKQIYPYVQKLL